MPIQTLMPFLASTQDPWIETRDGDPSVRDVYDRHYSRRKYKDGRQPKIFVGPGEKMILRTICGEAVFIWRKFFSMDSQTGINCAVFRNEGKLQSSQLILAAESKARFRWPDEYRLYTYINPNRVKSQNPGYCFKQAGWKKAGVTKSGLLVLAKEQPWSG